MSGEREQPIGPEVVFTRTNDGPVDYWHTIENGKRREATFEEVHALVAGNRDVLRNRVDEMVLALFDRGLQIHSSTRPAEINGDGTQRWYWNGKLHRDGDLPAIEEPSGQRSWFVDGEQHRETGPAQELGRVVIFWRHGMPILHPLDEIESEIKSGGRLLRLAGEANDVGDVPVEIVTLQGRRTFSGTLPYVGWFHWIHAHADERYPELAAAKRAFAMRNAMRAERTPVAALQKPRAFTV